MDGSSSARRTGLQIRRLTLSSVSSFEGASKTQRGIAGVGGAGTCLLVEMASAPLKVLIDSLNRE